MSLKKVVLTGVNGFIGSSLAKELLSLNRYLVVGLVRDLKSIEKYQFLKEFEGANERLIIEEGGELGSDYSLECYNRHFKDAYAIFHIASPFILYPDDVEKDLFKPAINGTLNVLKAAVNHQNSIKKVILASSTATIVNELNLKQVFTNQDWFNGKGLPFQYVESKYLSEMASLDYISSINNNNNSSSSNGSGESGSNSSNPFEFIRINPGLVTGPPVDNYPSNCSSLFLKNIKEIVNDKTDDPMYYGRTIVMCDIRDTIKYYIGALESTQSLHMERILIGNSTRSHSFKDVSDSIKLQFPNLNITQHIFNNNNQMQYYTLNYINPKLIFSDQSLISFSDSIKDTLNYYINNNK